MKTLVAAFPSFVNIFALLGIVYFIYSVLGVFLFNEAVVANKKYQNAHINFYNFGNALLTLFKCSTGEDWHMIMYEYSTIGKVQTYTFFISFILFTTFILLNMIILIVVSTFEEYYFGKDIEEQYMDMFEDFHQLWNTFARKTHGEKIPASKLVPFFKDLTAPLGFKIRITYDMDGKQDTTSEPNENNGFFYEKPIHEIYRDIYKLNIQVDQDGCVSFGLLLFHACKRAFGNSLMLNCASEENLQLLKLAEFETLREIYTIGWRKMQERQRKNANKVNPEGGSNYGGSNKYLDCRSPTMALEKVNPFISFMWVKMTFRSWLMYSEKAVQAANARRMGNVDAVDSSGGTDSRIYMDMGDSVKSSKDVGSFSKGTGTFLETQQNVAIRKSSAQGHRFSQKCLPVRSGSFVTVGPYTSISGFGNTPNRNLNGLSPSKSSGNMFENVQSMLARKRLSRKGTFGSPDIQQPGLGRQSTFQKAGTPGMTRGLTGTYQTPEKGLGTNFFRQSPSPSRKPSNKDS